MIAVMIQQGAAIFRRQGANWTPHRRVIRSDLLGRRLERIMDPLDRQRSSSRATRRASSRAPRSWSMAVVAHREPPHLQWTAANMMRSSVASESGNSSTIRP
jgi:hypothetical protein